MGDLHNLSDHPDYRPNFQDQDREDDPTREQRDYLDYLEAAEASDDPLSLLQTHEEDEAEVEKPQGLAVCQDCEYLIDRRPFWKRWFLRLSWSELDQWVCRAYPKRRVTHPLTGETAYVLADIPAHADPEPYMLCRYANGFGQCPKFRPRIWS